jgi:hypothetical protein
MLHRSIPLIAASAIAVLIPNPPAQAARLYQHDQGQIGAAFGLVDVNCVLPRGTRLADALWLNEFDLDTSANYINQISVVWGTPQTSYPCPNNVQVPTKPLTAQQPAQVFLYDTDANGRLRLVQSQQTVVTRPGTGEFANISIRPTKITGRKFYVAALLPNQEQGQFPIAIDTTGTAGRSYYWFNPAGSTGFDYSQITPTRYAFNPAGSFLLRATGIAKPIPEPGLGVGLLLIGTGIVLRRRSH